MVITHFLQSVPRRTAAALILAYRYGISPLLPPRCRFAPTCSEYALVAVRNHGAAKGLWLALRRLLRCHPWGGSGYDPVPCHDQGSHERHDHDLPGLGA